MGVSLQWWADEVGKRTGGKVTVETYPMSSLVEMQQMLDSVAGGVADIGILSIPSFEKRFPITNVIMLPTIKFPYTADGIVASGEAFRMLYNKYPALEAEYKDQKLRLVMLPGVDIQNIVAKKEIRVPGDLKGMKVGATGVRGKIVESCGGVPVSVITPEAYMSLERGVIDAIFTNWSMVAARKLQEVSSHYFDYQLYSLALMLVINVNTWNALPPDVQKIIDDLEADALVFRGDAYMRSAGGGKKLWSEAGNTVTQITPDEGKLWDAKVLPFEETWLADMGAAGFKEAPQILDDLKKKMAEAWK